MPRSGRRPARRPLAPARPALRSAAALLAVLATAAPAAAQQPAEMATRPAVRLEGFGDPDIDARLRRLLAEPGLRIVVSDTLIERGDTVRGSMLILGARVLMEGVVQGTLGAIDANLFLRPFARVEGDLLSVAGGYYPSALARVEGEVVDAPLAAYTLRREGEGWVIVARAEDDRRLALEGPLGLGLPTYDRVSGLSLRVGGAYRLPVLAGVEPTLSAYGVYRSARGALEGGVEAAVARGHWRLAGGAERTTVTNEWWVRSPLTNSLGFAWKGSDYFDHYRSTRVYGRLERTVDAGAWTLLPWAGVQREAAASLRARDPWVLLSPDSMRPNPAVDEGTLTSALLGLEAEWASSASAFEGTLELEGGEGFGRFLVDGEWSMDALFGHSLEIEGHFRGPLPGTTSVPLRRWSMVGDLGTLKTLEAPLRGDRLVWVETEYIIPLPPRLRLPLLGVPDLELLHEVGMAWSAEQPRDFAENIGARLQFFMLYVRVLTDPSDPMDELKVDVGVSSPF